MSVEDLTGALVFMFVAVIGILFFAFVNLIGEDKKTTDVEEQIENLNANDGLLHFLKIPAESDLGDNMADFILQSYMEEDYAKLKMFVKDYFGEVYISMPWKLNIKTSSGREVFKVESEFSGLAPTKISTSSVLIPVNKGNNVEYLEVSLSIVLAYETISV